MIFDLNLWSFDHMNIWRLPYYVNKPSLVQIGLSNEPTFTFSFFTFYNLTSDDLWPWYATFDLINEWGFPCCIYDPTLFEIHQSMRKIEPNVNLFSQQITTDNNINRQQQGTKWSQCVFPAKAGDTKRGRKIFTRLNRRRKKRNVGSKCLCTQMLIFSIITMIRNTFCHLYDTIVVQSWFSVNIHSTIDTFFTRSLYGWKNVRDIIINW